MRRRQFLAPVGTLILAVLATVIAAAIIQEGTIFQPDTPPNIVTSEAIATIDAGATRIVLNATLITQNGEVAALATPIIQMTPDAPTSGTLTNVPPFYVIVLSVFVPVIAGMFMGAVWGVFMGFITSDLNIEFLTAILIGVPGAVIGAFGGVAAGLFLGAMTNVSILGVTGVALWGLIWGLLGGFSTSVVVYKIIAAGRPRRRRW